MAQSDVERLLSEANRKLRTLQCICENTAASGGAIVKDYQPLDCNGDPVGPPIDVMATIAVAKQDVNICNVDAVLGGIYNIPRIVVVPPSSDQQLGDWSVDVTKLHSISITVIGTGVVSEFHNNLAGSSDIVNNLPTGFSTNFTATTTFGSGGVEIVTDDNTSVIVSMMLSA